MTEPIFGSMLRDARVRRSISIDEAARSLRIRNDILQSIENSDFQRMPPRSYARNMIVAYAKILDIDPEDVLKRYDDEFYSYQIGRKRQTTDASYSYRYANTPQPEPKRTTSNRVSKNARAVSQSRNRDHYEIAGYQNEHRRSQAVQSRTSARGSASSRSSQTSHRRSRHSVAPGREYLNVYSGSGYSTKRRIPSFVIIIAAVLVLLLAVFLIRMVACSPSTETASGAGTSITGLTDPEQNGISTSTGQNKGTPIAPTAAVFSYQVLKDKSAYIEVCVDDKLDVGGEMSGGEHDTYDVTGTLRFDTTNPDSVSLTVNGERVEPSEVDGYPGVYRYTVNFQDILSAWREANAEALNPTPEENPEDTAALDIPEGSEALSPSFESAMNAILSQEGIQLTTGVNATSSSGISTTVKQ